MDGVGVTMKVGSPLFRMRQLLRAVASSVGISIGAGAIALPASASAQVSDYQPTGQAPAAWREFAEQVQLHFRQQLSNEDGSVRQLNRLLEARRKAEDGPLNIVAKVWISPAGAVQRLEFDTLDIEAASNLRAVLIGSSMHSSPPRNMLQPMHLMLSLGQAN